MFETQYEALRRQGISRRSFLQFCSLTAASLGLGSAGAQEIAQAMKTKPRTPVVWLHGLECTCCTESFIRSYNPIAANMVMDLISLDYDDTIMPPPATRQKAPWPTPSKSTRATTSLPWKATSRLARTACSAFRAARRS